MFCWTLHMPSTDHDFVRGVTHGVWGGQVMSRPCRPHSSLSHYTLHTTRYCRAIFRSALSQVYKPEAQDNHWICLRLVFSLERTRCVDCVERIFFLVCFFFFRLEHKRPWVNNPACTFPPKATQIHTQIWLASKRNTVKTVSSKIQLGSVVSWVDVSEGVPLGGTG